MTYSKFERVKSIINSCETYEQVQTCFVFVNSDSFFTDVLEKTKILGILQSKAYQLRNDDLKNHNQEIKKIFNR
jgi:hypothetical protein